MALATTIKRWGNSAAVRIPRDILSRANLVEGNHIEFVLTSKNEILLRPVRQRQTIQEIFADYDGGFFQTQEIHWGEPQGDEAW